VHESSFLVASREWTVVVVADNETPTRLVLCDTWQRAGSSGFQPLSALAMNHRRSVKINEISWADAKSRRLPMMTRTPKSARRT
jgi:hypothetical protein